MIELPIRVSNHRQELISKQSAITYSMCMKLNNSKFGVLFSRTWKGVTEMFRILRSVSVRVESRLERGLDPRGDNWGCACACKSTETPTTNQRGNRNGNDRVVLK